MSDAHLPTQLPQATCNAINELRKTWWFPAARIGFYRVGTMRLLTCNACEAPCRIGRLEASSFLAETNRAFHIAVASRTMQHAALTRTTTARMWNNDVGEGRPHQHLHLHHPLAPITSSWVSSSSSPSPSSVPNRLCISYLPVISSGLL